MSFPGGIILLEFLVPGVGCAGRGVDSMVERHGFIYKAWCPWVNLTGYILLLHVCVWVCVGGSVHVPLNLCVCMYMHAPMNGSIWIFVFECIHITMSVLMKVCMYLFCMHDDLNYQNEFKAIWVYWVLVCLLVLFVCFWDTAGLKLSMCTRLVLNSQNPTCPGKKNTTTPSLLNRLKFSCGWAG